MSEAAGGLVGLSGYKHHIVLDTVSTHYNSQPGLIFHILLWHMNERQSSDISTGWYTDTVYDQQILTHYSMRQYTSQYVNLSMVIAYQLTSVAWQNSCISWPFDCHSGGSAAEMQMH